jgi:hypothetical protein
VLKLCKRNKREGEKERGGERREERGERGKVQGRASRSHRLKVGVYAWSVSEEWSKVNVRTNFSGDS